MIEYAGNVIRSIQTDKREKYYDSKVRAAAYSLGPSAAVGRGHQTLA